MKGNISTTRKLLPISLIVLCLDGCTAKDWRTASRAGSALNTRQKLRAMVQPDKSTGLKPSVSPRTIVETKLKSYGVCMTRFPLLMLATGTASLSGPHIGLALRW